MKMFFTLLLLCQGPGIMAQENAQYKLHFVNAPIEIVLAEYANISKKKVEIVKGVRASVTIISDKVLSQEDSLQLIENKLTEANIGLFPIGENRFVAAWIDPTRIQQEPIVPPAAIDLQNEQQKRQLKSIIRESRPPLPVPAGN